jgi:hypothetical protein
LKTASVELQEASYFLGDQRQHRNREKFFFLRLLSSFVLKVLASEFCHRNKIIKGIQFVKKNVKLTLFSKDITNVKIPEDSKNSK